jgi:uncharacterized protein YqeY
MKARDDRTVATVRLILAVLKDRDIAVRSQGNMEGIGDDEILTMLQSMIKQRNESIALYEKGGRQELADQEKQEIGVIEQFLPTQLGEEEMSKVITDVIADLEAKTLKDMGRVMGTLKERYPGQMDFAKASAAVKEQLG